MPEPDLSPEAVERLAHDLEDEASRDNMGVMHHPAADALRALSTYRYDCAPRP